MYSLKETKKVVIEGSSYCNIYCPQCPRYDTQGNLTKNLQPEHLNFENFTKNFDLGYFDNLYEVEFQGDFGDSMMHPDIEKFLEYLSSVPRVTIFTNGSMRNQAFWKSIAQYKNLHVVFSVDGLSDTNHLYRVGSDFEKIINNATAFITAGGNAHWKFVVFKHNEHQVADAQKMSEQLGFKSFWSVVSGRSWFGGDTWPVFHKGKDLGYSIHPASTAIPSSTLLARTGVYDVTNTDIDIHCQWLNNYKIYITCRGDVIPCCMTNGPSFQSSISSQMWKRLVGDPSSINLNYKHIAIIDQSEFWAQSLTDSFTNVDTMLFACVSACNKCK